MDLSTAVTAPGSLAVAGNATLGDASASDSHTINGTTYIDGATATTGVYLRDGSFNCNYEDSGSSTCYINQFGYLGGATQYRSLIIQNANGSNIARFNAATLLTELLGPATVSGDTTLGDATGDVLDVNGSVSKFGNADGAAYMNEEAVNFLYATNAAGNGYINFHGYQNGTTQFRNLVISDGKEATVATFTGSSKALDVVGPISTTGSTGNLNVSREGYFGSTRQVYVAFNETQAINFAYDTNSAQTGLINSVGYQGGTTQFRNLHIQDGKGANVATFTGSGKAVAFLGTVTVTDIFTLDSTANNSFIVSGGAKHSGSAPTLTSCGGSPSATTGGMLSSSVTTGSAATGCVITFPTAFGNTPTCVVTTQDTTKTFTYTTSTTAITLSTVVASAVYDYICVGH